MLSEKHTPPPHTPQLRPPTTRHCSFKALGSAATPPFHDFREYWSCRPPDLGLRRPRLLQLGDGPPAAFSVARVNRRKSTLSGALRPAPKLDVGNWAWVYNTAAATRRREARHGRQGPQGHTLAQLDGPLLTARSWPLLLSGHPGRISSL